MQATITSDQLTLDLGIDATIGVRDLIVRGEIEATATKARRELPAPTFEQILMDGADCAFRRRVGDRSQLLVLLVTQGQYYVADERTGSRHQLTTARLASFCKGAEGDALTPPWSLGALQHYDARGRAALLGLLGLPDFRELAKRDMARLAPWAATRMGRNAEWRLSGCWEDCRLVWQLVEPLVGHEHAREALSVALSLAHMSFEGRDMGVEDAFRERRYVRGLVEGLSRDVARDLVSGYLDACATHPRAGMSDFFCRMTAALGTMEWRGISFEPRRVCDYALSLLDLDPEPRRTRAYNVQLWCDCLTMQHAVRGTVTEKYPRDPRAALDELRRERDMRRHEASDAAVGRRCGQLSGHAYGDDSYSIVPAATVQDIIDEANAQSNCLASYIDKYASGQTDLYLMREAGTPDTPLVTVEVRGGTVRQAFRSHNRQLTEGQRRWLAEWCAREGFRMPRGVIRPMCA